MCYGLKLVLGRVWSPQYYQRYTHNDVSSEQKVDVIMTKHKMLLIINKNSEKMDKALWSFFVINICATS